MKIKQLTSLLLTVILLCSLLTACGGASKTMAAYDMAAPMEEAMVEEPAAMQVTNGSAPLSGAGETGSTVLPESRKWIVTIHLSAETEDLDTLTAALDEKIAGLGGYVEDQNVYNGSAYSSRRYRSASLTVRIPAEKADSFTQDVAGLANVVRQEKNLEDVTLNYVATESRVTALETEEARLLELLAQAENMSDLLEIEARLTDVRYELESHASQLRLYDNQIDYATIYLNIEEVQEYTPVEEPTFWERITGGFGDSLSGLWESLQDLLVAIVVSFPFLVVYGGLALILVLLLRRARRINREKKAKKSKKDTPAE